MSISGNQDHFDLILVGTGFASSFFLHKYLELAATDVRVLVLERGNLDQHHWQVVNRQTSSQEEAKSFSNQTPAKPWVFNLSFGGGSNCWWASTPRMLPNDFKMASVYGVGRDWPITYDELEPYYARAEEIMAISGPSSDSPFDRSTPYPQPPHRFTEVDLLLKAAYPDTFFHAPAARARLATQNRNACCASGVCRICPANAKFTIQNELRSLYEDRRVQLELGAEALTIETSGGMATGVTFRKSGKQTEVSGELIATGANAIFQPASASTLKYRSPRLWENT